MPIRGGIGVAIVIVVLLGGMLLDVPGLRLPAIAGIVGGVIVAAALFAWHRHTSSQRVQGGSLMSKPTFTQPCGNPKGCDGTATLKLNVPLQRSSVLRPDSPQFKYECPKCGYVEFRAN